MFPLMMGSGSNQVYRLGWRLNIQLAQNWVSTVAMFSASPVAMDGMWSNGGWFDIYLVCLRRMLVIIDRTRL